VEAFVIGPAMADLVAHRPNQRKAGLALAQEYPSYSAHIFILPCG
jgi:hypothetical protein